MTSVSLVNRLTIAESQSNMPGYYRSRLFSTPNSSNPLLSAASPIFSLLGRLAITQILPPVNSMRESIEHELRAFLSTLKAENYASDLITLARYLLCATIDELLGKSYLRVHDSPAQFQAFTPLSNDGIEPQERFFEIVYFVREQPNQYLDVIELAWFCLISGFEGREHVNANGRQTLDNLIEELYLLIQQYRVNKPKTLFNNPLILPTENHPNYLLMVLTIIGSIALLMVVFAGFHLYLDSQTANLKQHHSLLVNEDD